MPRVGDVHSLRSLAFVHTSHRMAHKVLLASLGAGDYSSASIVVPFSVYTMPKRKAKGTAAGGTSAVVCCICSTLRCLPAGTAKRRAAVQEAESASAKKSFPRRKRSSGSCNTPEMLSTAGIASQEVRCWMRIWKERSLGSPLRHLMRCAATVHVLLFFLRSSFIYVVQVNAIRTMIMDAIEDEANDYIEDGSASKWLQEADPFIAKVCRAVGQCASARV